MLFHFLMLFGVWLLFTWTLEIPDVIAGVIVSLILAVLLNSIFDGEVTSLLNPVKLFWAIIYIPVFFYHMMVANLDVAYRVLNPGLPIKPGIVKVKTKLKSDLGKTTLANSITLTPGTLTVDIKGEYLYIHWINVLSDNVEEATKEIVDKFEKYIVRFYG
ncbi:MAG: Na+/H+ antiporter subunit E [Acidobacteria bacterium]|nr:Na+/H+ antiporter subunit E [Acidobacteriota bacterium]